MSLSEKDIETYMENELKPEDTFRFDCKMCGSCCRCRSEPIVLTGVDIYRIARALDMPMSHVVESNTLGCIGSTSHMPVLVLRERMDGSCRLLRKGRCMVQQDKPVVCALFPLGRFYSYDDQKFHYFMNQKACQSGRKDGKEWTLQAWLDEFRIVETEEMTRAWNRLIGGLSMVTKDIAPDKIKGRILDVILPALYLDYRTDKPYIEQVEQHMILLKDVFKHEFHKNLTFG